MTHEVTEPTLDEHGSETHPAFATIGANRGSYGPPGATLFDSDIKHGHTVTIRLHTATRRRDISHDYIHSGQRLFEVEMSEAQWASFVSSMNVGDGVPCTLRARETDYDIDGLPYAPRLAVSMQETHDAAQRLMADIREKFELVKEKPTKANLWSLECALNNATPNVDYVAKKLAEHAENVVNKSRADIEAIVASKATQLGIEAFNPFAPQELEAAEETP